MRPSSIPTLGDNLAFERRINVGEVDRAFAEAAHVVSARYEFGRHTGVTLEPRAVVADYNAGTGRLTVYQGTQAPHMVQNILATHLGLEEAQVRVVCKDVGGSFGIKVHIYADEMATAALSKLLKRPVKFVADRLESFLTDIHARDHSVDGRMAIDAQGRITALEIDDITGIGPYSMYPRTSAVETNQVLNLTGGPYARAGLPGARPRRVPEQDDDEPVPRGRASRSPPRSPKGSLISRQRLQGSTPSSSAAAIWCATTPIRARRRQGSSSRASRTTPRSTSCWR